jgi:hypothetical protein
VNNRQLKLGHVLQLHVLSDENEGKNILASGHVSADMNNSEHISDIALELPHFMPGGCTLLSGG